MQRTMHRTPKAPLSPPANHAKPQQTHSLVLLPQNGTAKAMVPKLRQQPPLMCCHEAATVGTLGFSLFNISVQSVDKRGSRSTTASRIAVALSRQAPKGPSQTLQAALLVFYVTVLCQVKNHQKTSSANPPQRRPVAERLIWRKGKKGTMKYVNLRCCSALTDTVHHLLQKADFSSRES